MAVNVWIENSAEASGFCRERFLRLRNGREEFPWPGLEEFTCQRKFFKCYTFTKKERHPRHRSTMPHAQIFPIRQAH